MTLADQQRAKRDGPGFAIARRNSVIELITAGAVSSVTFNARTGFFEGYVQSVYFDASQYVILKPKNRTPFCTTVEAALARCGAQGYMRFQHVFMLRPEHVVRLARLFFPSALRVPKRFLRFFAIFLE